MPTAILVDGAFFLKRHRHIYGLLSPEIVAKKLYQICLEHLSKQERDKRELYRIFFYDCMPLTKKAHNPLTKRAIDFSKTSESVFRLALHEELRKTRKVALRLGQLADNEGWLIHPETTQDLLKGKMKFSDLTEKDIFYSAKQKGVDMKIGVDIASLAFKKQVDQIILIAGDSDFVPAAKLARREGIDFILDSMWNPIKSDLREHIDGLQSTCKNPKIDGTTARSPVSQPVKGTATPTAVV